MSLMENPIIKYLYSKENKFDDEKTWDLICTGRNCGLFQMESNLISAWSKRCKPRSIEELSDLIALVRPGTLEAVDENGKSMAKVYVDRKHGVDKIEYLHPSLEPILNKTYGVILYQEQILTICKEIAGFTLVEADSARING